MVQLMSEKSCSSCGNETLEPGWIVDARQGMENKWVRGAMERGIFGGPKQAFKDKWEIEAYRCTRCSKLELYALDPGY